MGDRRGPEAKAALKAGQNKPVRVRKRTRKGKPVIGKPGDEQQKPLSGTQTPSPPTD